MKTIHLDLTLDPASALQDLEKRLTQVSDQDTIAALTLASQETYMQKLSGTAEEFRIVHYSQEVKGSSAQLVGEILSLIPGVERSEGSFSLGGRTHHYADGTIEGHNAVHYVASMVEEDLAIVLRQGKKLTYVFDCSLYEKTPKDPRTGENTFIGKDLIEFHGRARNFGHVLPSVLGAIVQAFDQRELDMLTIDLRGGHTYTDGSVEVRRFERDHLIPIPSGLLAYAQVFFQPTTENRSPYQGGATIDTTHFHRRFRVNDHG